VILDNAERLAVRQWCWRRSPSRPILCSQRILRLAKSRTVCVPTGGPAPIEISPSHDTFVVTTTSLLGSILNWLRAGYPEGVPGPDRVPLLALLRATPLTEEQVTEVVKNLTADGSTAVADGSIDDDEIASFISDVTHHDAGPDNVKRVAAKLAAAGWPLAGTGDAAH
jgi:Protein of unknown function (DUF3349)